jgi:hypothetical protein
MRGSRSRWFGNVIDTGVQSHCTQNMNKGYPFDPVIAECVSPRELFFYHPMFPRWDLSGSHLDFCLIVRGKMYIASSSRDATSHVDQQLRYMEDSGSEGGDFLPAHPAPSFPCIPVFTRDLAHELPRRSSQLTFACFIEDGRILGGHRHRVIRCAACVRGPLLLFRYA